MQPDQLSGATQERTAILDERHRTATRPAVPRHAAGGHARGGPRPRRRHLSPATRAALAHTREVHIDLGDLLVLGVACGPCELDVAPVRLHPIGTGRHHGLGLDAGVEALVAVALPGRAVVHPALRQLGDTAARYLRARRWVRRWYLSRQLAYGLLATGVVLTAPILASAADRSSVRLATAAEARFGAGSVGGFGQRVTPQPASVAPLATAPRVSVGAPTVAAADTFGGRWVDGIHGRWFVPYPANPNTRFLACTRHWESDTAGGYRAVDWSSRHFGAYQFLQSTWNNVARSTGRVSLVGVNPAAASPRDQDWMALYLYRWLGASHWQNRCAGM